MEDPQGRCDYLGPRISLRNQDSPASLLLGTQRQSKATCPRGPQRLSTLGGDARRPLVLSIPEALPILTGSGPASARAPGRRRLLEGLCAEGLGHSSNLPRWAGERGQPRPMGGEATPPQSARSGRLFKGRGRGQPPVHRIPAVSLAPRRLSHCLRSPCFPSAPRSPPSLTSSSCSCRR